MSHRDYLLTLERLGIKLGLAQIRALLDHMGHPERAWRSVVAGGTNGKGSVTAMVERGLRAAGHRTGRYTSPHLIDLEERFAVDGQAVSADALESAAGRVRDAAGRLESPPSFFEATTAAAFEIFRDAGVHVAVLEVGLGGRLDATNVTTPDAIAITSIALDHEELLGATLAQIAAEKAGIVTPGSLVVLGANPAEAAAVVAAVCAARGATLVRAPDDVALAVQMEDGRARLALETPRRRYEPLTLSLRGRHQVDNALVAIRLLEALDARGELAVPERAIRRAVEDAVWPGRLDLRPSRFGEVLIDGAHNPAAAAALARFIAETYGRRLPMVVGMMREKDAGAMLRALEPAAALFVFTSPASPRAAAPDDLAARAAAIVPDVPCTVDGNPARAVSRASQDGTPVVVAGSLYLAGEVLAGLAGDSS
jgi:dihydrofolate synthase/folylpolyglutamate synthase